MEIRTVHAYRAIIAPNISRPDGDGEVEKPHYFTGLILNTKSEYNKLIIELNYLSYN